MNMEQPGNSIEQEFEQLKAKLAENIRQATENVEALKSVDDSVIDENIKKGLIIGATGISTIIGAFMGTIIAPGTELPAIGAFVGGMVPIGIALANELKNFQALMEKAIKTELK